MTEGVIDTTKLPASMLLDTTVALRGFGAYGDDPRGSVCVALVDACLRQGTSLLIAAPTLAEILRGGATRAVPRVAGVEVVAFDDVAAELLGRVLPQASLQEFATAEGLKLTYLKYDALIVACALRYRAGCFVCLDDRQASLRQERGRASGRPDGFPGHTDRALRSSSQR